MTGSCSYIFAVVAMPSITANSKKVNRCYTMFINTNPYNNKPAHQHRAVVSVHTTRGVLPQCKALTMSLPVNMMPSSGQGKKYT